MERWKDVNGYEGLYQVSNYGRVRSQDRCVKTGDYSRIIRGKVLNGSSNGKGYIKIVLHKDGTKKKEYVHRLVAFAFLENPDGKPFVNHKDNDPSNNNVSNLEWCTHKENMDWMNVQGRAKRTESWLRNLHESQEKMYTAIVGENVTTGEKVRFRKLNDVAKAGYQPSCVCNCCKGTRKTHKGYRWNYEKIVECIY